jgi:hypothetical protein
MLYESPSGKLDSRAMDVTMFEDMIDRLGEDLSRWPDDQRLAAEDLLSSSSEARALLEEARALRQALAAPPVRAPAGLADRIVAAASELPAEPATPRAEDDAVKSSVGSAPAGKVLPALLLALCVLPALATPSPLCTEPDASGVVCALL